MRAALDDAAVRTSAVALSLLGLAVVAACQGGPSLSTTQQETVVVSPTSSDFGTVEVGQASAVRTFTVRPAIGNQYDVVTAITESCPDFTVDAPGLPAEVYRECSTSGEPIPVKGDTSSAAAICEILIDYQEYSFSTRFTPTVAGAVSCVVTITTNNTTNRTITLSGTGTLPPIRADVQPGSVAFGDVRRGTQSTAAGITVRNLGGQTMTVSSVSVSAGFAITAGPTGTYTLGPSGAQGYSVRCAPTAVGTLTGNFVVNSNDPARPQVAIPLSCRGIDSNLDITPSPTTLPTTRVGEPVEATIELVNTGTASMTLGTVALTSTDLEMLASPPGGTVLAPGGRGAVRVRYAAAAAGSASGTLDITYDEGQTRSAQISARALPTSMALTPDGDVDLGPICVGQTKTQPFSLIANAEAAFQVSAIAEPMAPFALAAPTLPATVQGAGATTLAFDVTAAPTEPGYATSTMTITTDIPGAAPREVHLAATGLAAGVTPTPAELYLGSLAVETTGIGEKLELSNCTATPVAISNARIEGRDAADFAIVAQPEGGMLAANATAAWLVILSPRSVGPKEATFLVDHDGGTATVSLTGEGLGADITGGGSGPASYYACSTGTPSALWPLALAFGLLALRRRR